MDPRMIPKGAPNGEYNYGEQDGTRRPNEAGIYYHPGADKFVASTAAVDPEGNMMLRDGKPVFARNSGKIQADAFVQMGYRPANDKETAEYLARQKAAEEAKRKAKSKTTTVMSSSSARN